MAKSKTQNKNKKNNNNNNTSMRNLHISKIIIPDDDAVKVKKYNAPKLIVSKNGPYLVSGSLPLKKEIIVIDKKGNPSKWKNGEKYELQESYALCRCGYSGKKPFCDTTHKKISFDGTETASRKSFIDSAMKLVGPNLVIGDYKELCSLAEFCHKDGGVWDLTLNSNNEKSREQAIKECQNCPSGRLVAFDKKTMKAIEPKFPPSISVTKGPKKNESGPLWLKGNIPVESYDGQKYEVRNRVTLCRCGKSENKPFCDATHVDIKFSDID